MLAGRYALQNRLGGSGTGDCWRATDTVLDRAVVVKLIDPGLVADAAFVERLKRELRMVALASHPSIARLLDTGEDDGTLFVVREYVEGESVRQLLDTVGHVAAEDAIQILRSTLDGLAAAHEAGVLHLDLKPENVIVGPGGTVKVCDLGLGEALIDERSPQDGAAALDPAPLAPELWAGAAPDARSDVWGSGALLFEILSGRPPANGGGARSTGRTDLPRKLDDAVTRALAPDPDDRFESAEAFSSALHAIPAGAHRPAATLDGDRGTGERSLPPPPRPSLFRTWLAVPLLVALLVVGAAAIGLWAGKLRLGGPVGIRLNEGSTPGPSPAAHVLGFSSVAPFDPYGDGHENDSGLPLAADDKTDTAWKSEAYRYPAGGLGKPGVGMLFDLGSEQTVTGFRLQTPFPGYRFTVIVGDDPYAMAQGARGMFTAGSDMREAITPATARYVLLWITSVVPTNDGNRAEVGEFRVVGPA